MTSSSCLDEAIAAYRDWRRPWTFRAMVADRLASEPSASNLFAEAWAEATDPRHWAAHDASPTFAGCCDAAHAALTARFPGLRADSIRALVNAASYQWR